MQEGATLNGVRCLEMPVASGGYVIPCNEWRPLIPVVAVNLTPAYAWREN